MKSPHADTSEHRRMAARASGMLMLAGAAVAALAVVLPPRATGSEALVLILGGLAAAVGTVLLTSRRTPSERVLGLAAFTGTVLITVSTHEGGTEVGTGTADDEMLYVWVCLLAFSFLSLPHALAQLGVVGLAYAWLLVDVPLDEAATRWLVTMTALLVAGLLVARLRSNRDRLVAELSDKVRHDGLTGLLNRAALEDCAVLELARARRYGLPLSLVVVDVDHFKDLNDTRGHPAGDHVLREIAGRLESETRQIDALARLGGDEFAVLLPGASGADAAVVANRLCDAAQSNGGPEVTLSIGVAAGPPSDHAFETLWRAADEAMYEAKRAGGDSVRMAGELPAERD